MEGEDAGSAFECGGDRFTWRIPFADGKQCGYDSSDRCGLDFLALAGVLLLSYYRKKKRLGRLKRLSEGLKERYLLAELLPEPQDAEEEVWFFLLKQAFKSMLEQTNDVLREREEYREYLY